MSGLFRILLVLIAALGIAYFFYNNFKEAKEENVQLQGELAELEKQWVKLRRQQGEEAFNRQKMAEIQEQLTRAQNEAAELERLVNNQQGVVRGLENTRQRLFQEHRENVWKSAAGDFYEKIVTPQGNSYEKVTITGVRANEVSFMFGVGAKGHSLSLDRLPAHWIKKFLYTPAELKAAQAAAKLR